MRKIDYTSQAESKEHYIFFIHKEIIPMLQKELIERSPVRVLEKSTHGGVGIGNIGVFAAKKGVGKTACLVHVATDQLFQGKHVIHVSFQPRTSHIISWYEDIFQEIARRYSLENAMDIHDEIVKNRVIMNFTQDGVHMDAIQNSIKRLMATSSFKPDIVVIDGYNFSLSTTAELQSLRQFSLQTSIELWFSATIPDSDQTFDAQTIPQLLAPVISEIAVVICLQPKADHIHLNVVKDHDTSNTSSLQLTLDPRLLLIAY